MDRRARPSRQGSVGRLVSGRGVAVHVRGHGPVETDIDASPAVVWGLVTDIELPARFSTEFLGATWDSDDRDVGAVFHGRNRHPAIGEWTIPCYIDVRHEGRVFGWCTSNLDRPGARWRFELEPTGGGTRLRFSYLLGPGQSGTTRAIAMNPGKEDRVLRRRLNDVQANMQATIDGLKALAETGS